jgi:hypothetical protein
MSRISRIAEASHGPEDPGAGSPPPATEEGKVPGAGQSSPDRTEVVGAAEHYAGHLRESTASLFHTAAMANAFKGVDAQAFKIYRDRLLADCGKPTDPIEIMIIEELSLAHFTLGVLMCKRNNITRYEATGIYSGAAARLMGEFRRSALALQAYRHASMQLSRGPAENVEQIEGSGLTDDLPGKSCDDNEQGVTTEESDADETIILYPEPAAIGDRDCLEPAASMTERVDRSVEEETPPW